MIPEHIKRDLSQHTYDTTLRTIDRLVKPFGLNPETLAIASSATMRAGFLTLFTATKLQSKNATAEMVLDAWVELMREELLAHDVGFVVAQEKVQKEINNV